MSISAIKYPSINAKLKGMYAKRLKDDDLQDLAKQNNLKSAVAILKNKSSSLNVLSEDADREQIEKVLNGEIIYDIEKIVKYLDKNDTQIFNLLISKYEIRCIKKAIKLLYSKNEYDENIKIWTNTIFTDLKGLESIKSIDEFFKIINNTKYKKILKKYFENKDTEYSIFEIENELDKMYLKSIYNSAGNNKNLKKMIGAKIDFTNFNSSDRLEKETYQESDGIKIDKDKINNKVLKFENDDGELCFTYLDDDGSYFDEIVSGAWYDENGAPLAKMPPLNLWRKGHLWTGDLNDFHFVNPKGFTMDQLKRTNPSDDMEGDLYAIILKNITKEQGDDNMIYYGEDYYTGEEVMFRGKYSKILNGDNVLIIGQFIGLTEDDSPELDVWRVELCNDRF